MVPLAEVRVAVADVVYSGGGISVAEDAWGTREFRAQATGIRLIRLKKDIRMISWRFIGFIQWIGYLTTLNKLTPAARQVP
jgi:hypothetical protein